MENKIILLVEDDEDDRSFFIEALAKVDNSIVCHTASDGCEALSKLETNSHTTPDMIVMDINMPKMNGIECLQLLKESNTYKNIPIVMYSTSAQTEVKQKCLNMGAIDFIQKPDNFSSLCDEIKRMIYQ